MLYIVCGLPGTGKTTWVQQHMKPGDIVYDLDALAGAMTYKVDERNNPAARYIANEFFYTFVDAFSDVYREGHDVYLIRTAIKPKQMGRIGLMDSELEVNLLLTQYEDREISEEAEEEIVSKLNELDRFCQIHGIKVNRIGGAS